MGKEAGGFQTPEEVAAAETPKPEANSTSQTGDSTPITNDIKKHRFNLKWPPDEPEWVAIIGVAIIIVGSFISLYIANKVQSKPAAQTAIKRTIKPAPKTTASNLSGLQVDPSVNQRPVIGVMVENSMDARPQSGLSQASVVYEAIAEGGITRFLALFQDTSPDDVGPIRSARPYYVQWALGFDAAYAHVGGSPEAIADIRAWGVKDMDQFYNAGSYRRISSRAAPHNVYTGVGTLTQLATSKGYNTSTFTSFTRKKKETPSKQPTAKSIDFALSGALYNVHYDYNAAANSYNRSEGGAPHMDATGNVQISPKVVIGLVMPYGIQSDGKHSDYGTVGSGPAYVFQDGILTIGTWTKADDKAQITFTDAAGKPLALNPGPTWLTALGGTGNISYAP